MPVSLYCFKRSIAIALPILLAVLFFTRSPAGRSNRARLLIAFIVALAITPTVINPYDKWYVECAAIVAILAIVGFGNFIAFLYGALPIALVTTILFGLTRRKPQTSPQV